MPQRPVYTIGHSNHTLDKFVELLRLHAVQVVVDVRSRPYSRYREHFHGPLLQNELPKFAIKYVFLGKELGGMPDNPALQNEDGDADYERIIASPLFAAGMERLQKGIAQYSVAMMCGEENPSGCHRRHLLSSYLATLAIVVQHIRGDGRLETEEDLRAAEEPAHRQLDLFSN